MDALVGTPTIVREGTAREPPPFVTLTPCDTLLPTAVSFAALKENVNAKPVVPEETEMTDAPYPFVRAPSVKSAGKALTATLVFLG